jgi:hypothetical protein
MKVFLSLAAIATATLITSCTTTTTTTRTAERKDVELTPEKRTYSANELQKRGRQTPGEALAAQDASVTYTGRH